MACDWLTWCGAALFLVGCGTGVQADRQAGVRQRPSEVQQRNLLHGQAETRKGGKSRSRKEVRRSDFEVFDAVPDFGFFGVVEAVQGSDQIAGDAADALKFYACTYKALMIGVKSAVIHGNSLPDDWRISGSN